MDKTELETKAWADLFSERIRAKNAWAPVLDRAEYLIEAGVIPLERVLDALDMTRATYYRRQAARRAEKAGNREYHENREREEGSHTRSLFGERELVHYISSGQSAVCKLYHADAPAGDVFVADFPSFSANAERAGCPACRDYTKGWKS